MQEFFRYFFGSAPEEVIEFRAYSLAHLIPILVAAGAIYAIWHFREPLRTSRFGQILPWVLAFSMIVCEMSYFWRLCGHPGLTPIPEDHLPITVCGWATIFGSYMIVTKSQRLFDIVYFWIFAGSIFALISPAVIANEGPTRFRYYQFWGEHLIAYIATFYLIFVEKMRPTVRSIIRAASWLAVLTGVAILANNVVGGEANYLFLATTEEAKSILDFLPTSLAIRLPVMASVVAVFFFLSYLPWMIMDIKKKKAAAAPAPAEEASVEQTEA